jgi:HK97 family phage prohead protease
MPDRPVAGQIEDRSAPDLLSTDERRIRGRIPYGIQSGDMGGWREVIEPGAFANTRFDNLVAVVDHVGVPLGRHPGTLQLEDRADGLHWSVEPPDSRADIREAVERGDLRAGSWRMRVGRDEWRGNVRHVHEVELLRDVSIATRPAYDDAVVEYRSQPDPADGQEDEMPDEAAATEADQQSDETRNNDGQEDRDETRAGSLRVDDRQEGAPARSLADEYRSRGFPGQRAELSFDEFRSVTWSGSVNDLAPSRRGPAADLGTDRRWVWPAMPQQGVDSGTTAVDVPTQTARSVAAASSVVRTVAATSAKPETGSTLAMVSTAMQQVANVQSGIPNVYLESPQINRVVEQDLRLGVSGGLDKLVLDKIAASPFRDPGTDNLVAAVRKTITVLLADGYMPDTLVVPPDDDEALDLLVTGLTGGTADYVFSPGQGAPSIWDLNRRVSKDIPAAAVLDSRAFGVLYVSPISLARFEENDGSTNTSLVRLEGNAVFGVERQDACVRIAAA